MSLDPNRWAGLVIAYFLSREDKWAYDSLALGTQSDTHRVIGERLQVPKNTVKNWRDEFDAVHHNARRGWHQRPLRPSRVRVADQFAGVSREALLSYVQRLLGLFDTDIEVDVSVDALAAEVDAGNHIAAPQSARALTGHKAEEYFVEWFASSANTRSGTLVDRRHSGEGFDFELQTEGLSEYYEVKGLADESGTVSMTRNEFIAARHYKERYHLALVLGLAQSPRVVVVSDPTRKLKTVTRLARVVQETYTISASDIRRVAG